MLTGRRLGGTPRIERAADPDVALVGREEAGDHPQQRRLAAARRAEDRKETAVRDVERQRVDGRRRAVALADAVDFEILGASGYRERDAIAGDAATRAARRAELTVSRLSSPP